MSIKTTKRLALGIIASLVFAPLVAIAPASAASAGSITSWRVDAAGITETSDVSASSGEAAIYTRVGASFTIEALVANSRANGDKWRVAQISGADPATTPDAVFCVDTDLDAAQATTTCSITATAAMNGKVFRVQIKPAGGTYSVVTDLGVTLNVVNAGAPKSVTWAASAVTEIGTAADYTLNITPKDANGASTVLLDNESISLDVAPVTGAAATQVVLVDTLKTEGEATTAGDSTYSVTLSGDGDVNNDSTPDAGTTVPGVEYTITAQLVDGTTAIGAPVATKYKRLANTANLTGTVVFTSDSAGTTPITSIATAPTVATASFYALVKDSNGALVKGVTVAFTGGAVNIAAINTEQTGLTTANTATPLTAGTGTVTATITTGTSSITGTLSVVATAFGATVGTNASWAVVNNNGSGVKAQTAPNWDSALNVTSFTVTISGLDANKTAKVTVGGTATTAPKANGLTGTFYPVADAAGKIEITLTAGTTTATHTATLELDANNAGGTDTTLVITYRAADPELTTSPAASSLNMSTLSTSKAITATVTDQFGNPIVGGSVVISNTSAPAGVTLATASTVMVDATGKATVNAVIGSVAGSYVYSVQAKSIDNVNIGTASVVTFQATATGIAGSLTLADSDTTTTDDNKSTRAIYVADGASLANVTGLAANTNNAVRITVTSATPAGLEYTATATNGARLFTTSNPVGSAIAAGKASVTGTAGTDYVYAVPTKVGDSVITITAGGLTQTFTLTGALDAAAKAQLITLTPGTNANGKAVYTVTTTDTFGNAVSANVDVSVTGNAFLSNGFKAITIPTSAAGTNSFELVSPSGGASTVTAKIQDASYLAITATQATTPALTASIQSATATVTVVALEPVVVYEKPTLSFVKSGGRIVLSGTAVDGEGDIIIYVKTVGTTAWKEKAKTLEVAAPGDFNGSIRGFKKDKVIRVKQEGTGLFSNQVIVKRSR